MGHRLLCLVAHLFFVVCFWLIIISTSIDVGVDAFVRIEDFFSYGIPVGDGMWRRGDDSGAEVNLTQSFPFFGLGSHDKLFVNVNGAISFDKQVRDFTPDCVVGEFAMISPFWTDISTNNGGTLYFRETRDGAILAKAKAEITADQAFPQLSTTLSLNWAFVATWNDVAFYGALKRCDGFYLRNTFQAVLAADLINNRSFTIFNYNKIIWTTGKASDGDCRGLGGSPARAGFDAGDNSTVFRIPGSCTGDIVNIDETTNVGLPGKWIFAVDGPVIQDPSNSTTLPSTTTTTPPPCKYKQGKYKDGYNNRKTLKNYKTTRYYDQHPYRHHQAGYSVRNNWYY